MNGLEKIKIAIKKINFHNKYKLLLLSKKMKKFDDNFYSGFDQMYFNGLPIYYYLKRLNIGKCYDTSAILALAMGNDNYVCRGELHTLSVIDGEYFGHGWVEDEKFVYDTTWQIICPKEIYYKLFDVKNSIRCEHEEFFNQCKGIANWEIQNKEDFEKEHTLDTMLIYLVKLTEELKLQDKKISEEEKKFITKLLEDLPNIDGLETIPASDYFEKKSAYSR